ncbi:Hypothetical protein D9617_56g096130 [Elsinoe fawcettii]|nr:Hypothetical protein D9617_56g096130 [Elsinoe fawcettii]
MARPALTTEYMGIQNRAQSAFLRSIILPFAGIKFSGEESWILCKDKLGDLNNQLLEEDCIIDSLQNITFRLSSVVTTGLI